MLAFCWWIFFSFCDKRTVILRTAGFKDFFFYYFYIVITEETNRCCYFTKTLKHRYHQNILLFLANLQNTCSLIGWGECNIGHIVIWVSILYSLTRATTFDFCDAKNRNLLIANKLCVNQKLFLDIICF